MSIFIAENYSYQLLRTYVALSVSFPFCLEQFILLKHKYMCIVVDILENTEPIYDQSNTL